MTLNITRPSDFVSTVPPIVNEGDWCRLINSLTIIIQKDLVIKFSLINIYVYDCHVNHIYIYIFTARTMTM